MFKEYIFKCKDKEGKIWYSEQAAEDKDTAKQVIQYRFRHLEVEILSTWKKLKEE